MEQLLRAFITRQDEHNKKMMGEIATIKRGLYGDETNLVKGLMERQLEDERNIEQLEKSTDNRLRKLENGEKKKAWMAAGFLAAVEIIVQVAKWWKSNDPA